MSRNSEALSSQPICGYEEHIHEASCYDEAGVLICEKTEHTHTEDCFEQEPEEETETGEAVLEEETSDTEASAEPEEGTPEESVEEVTEEETPSTIETVTAELKHIIETAYDNTTEDTADDVTVTAEFDDGVLPEDVRMVVTAVDASQYEWLASQVTDIQRKELRTYDITFYKGDEAVEPNGEVKITFKADFIKEKTEPQIVHFEENENNVVEETTLVETEELKEGEISVTTESFSVYGIIYTVDFTYEVNGNTYYYSINGGTYVSLRTVLSALHVVSDEDFDDFMSKISYVWFSNESLVRVSRLDNNEWMLESLAPFTSEEQLVITMNDAQSFSVTVMDDQNLLKDSANIETNVLRTTYIPELNSFKTKINLRFTFTKTIDQIKQMGGNFVVPLNEGCSFPDEMLNVDHTVIDHTAEKEAFTYKMVKENDKYYIQIHFLENYLNTVNQINECGIAFEALIGENSEQADGSIAKDISDGITVTIPKEDIEYPENADAHNDVYGQKTQSGYGVENGKSYIDYQITVSTVKGTRENIVLNDAFKINSYKVNYNDASIKAENIRITGITKSGVAQTIPEITIDKQDNGISYSLVLDKLNAGENYVVNYRYYLSDKIEDPEETGSTSTNVQMNATNKVSIRSGDQHTDKESGFNYNKSNENVSLNKSGQYSDNKITWTITLNLKTDEAHSLNDDAFSVASDLTIQKKDGSSAEGNYNYTTGQNSITFNKAGEYKITYTTDVETDPFKAKKIKNIAWVDDGTHWKVEPEVNVPATGEISKTLHDVVENAGGSDHIKSYTLTWKVFFSVPETGFAANTLFTDKTTHAGIDNVNNYHVITTAQKTAIKNALEQYFGSGALTEVDPDNGQDTDNGQVSFKLINDWNNPNHIESIILEYTTTVVVDLDTVNRGLSTTSAPDQFTNEFSIDDLKASDSYNYRKEVNKLDGNNKGGGTITDEGIKKAGDTLTWAIVVVPEDEYDSMTITDTLPEGIVVDSVVIGHEYYGDTWSKQGETYVKNNNNEMKRWVSSVTESSGTLIISIDGTNLSERPDEMKKDAKLYAYVNAHIASDEFDALKPLDKQYTNRVSVKADGKDLGEDSQTQKVKLDSESLTKEAIFGENWTNHHQVEYHVEINKNGKQLTSDGSTYSMEDVLKFKKLSPDGKEVTVMLVPGSVELQEWNGTTYTTCEGNWAYQFIESKDGAYRIKTLSISGIPDRKPLRLVYKYRIDMADTQDHTSYNIGDLENTATIHAGEDYSEENRTSHNWAQFDTEGYANSANSLTLNKVDIGNYRTTLANARFVLEYWNPQNSTWTAVDAISENSALLVRDDDLNLLVYQTRNDGILKLYQPSNGTQFNYDVCYRVREYSAPTGYILSNDSEKQPCGYFYFSGQDTKTKPVFPNQTVASLADDLSVESDTFYISNAKQASIKITKKFVGDAELTEEFKKSARFKVYTSDKGILLKELSYDDILKNNNVITGDNIKEGDTYIVEEIVTDDIYHYQRTTTYAVNGVSNPTENTSTTSGESTIDAAVTIVNGVGTVDFTNEYNTPKTSIKVTKQWLKGDDSIQENPDFKTVSFQIYQKTEDTEAHIYIPYGETEAPVFTVQFDDTNKTWSESTVDNLPKYDSSNKAYQYYVKELNVSDLRVTDTYKLGDDGTENNKPEEVSVTNDETPIIIINRDVEITVKKKIIDANDIEIEPEEGTKIQFKISGKTQYNPNGFELITGELEYRNNKWSTFRTKLPSKDNSVPFQSYTINETTTDGYSVTYLINGAEISDDNVIRNDKNQEITIVNKERMLTVTKRYEDIYGIEKTPENGSEIKFKVYGNGQSKKDIELFTGNIVYSTSSGWTQWRHVLPSIRNGEQLIDYYVLEDNESSSGYNVSYLVNGEPLSETNKLTGETAEQVTIINREQPADHGLYLKKVWDIGEETPPDSITVKVNAIPDTREPEKVHIYAVKGAQESQVSSINTYDSFEGVKGYFEFTKGSEVTLSFQRTSTTQIYAKKINDSGAVTDDLLISWVEFKGSDKQYVIDSLEDDIILYIFNYEQNDSLQNITDFIQFQSGNQRKTYDESEWPKILTLDKQHNWEASIPDSNLPLGYVFQVAEVSTGSEGYTVFYKYTDINGIVHSNEIAMMWGCIDGGPVVITNYKEQSESYNLPESGGTGNQWHIAIGCGLIAVSSYLLLRRKRREVMKQ